MWRDVNEQGTGRRPVSLPGIDLRLETVYDGLLPGIDVSVGVGGLAVGISKQAKLAVVDPDEHSEFVFNHDTHGRIQPVVDKIVDFVEVEERGQVLDEVLPYVFRRRLLC